MSTTATSASSTTPSVVRATTPLAPLSLSSAIVTAGECTIATDANRIEKPRISATGAPFSTGRKLCSDTSVTTMPTKLTTSSAVIILSSKAPRSRTSSICSSAPARNAISAIASWLTGASCAITGALTKLSAAGPTARPAAR